MKRVRLKSQRVTLRLTGDVLERIDRAAATAKLDRAEWMRRKLLTAAERQDPEVRTRLLAGALAALEEGVSPATLRRLREARRS